MMNTMRDIIVLGSTGSIGVQALEVIAANPDRFRVVGLAAGSNRALVEQQAREHGVEHVALGAEAAAQLVRDVHCDVVLNGITGSVGLAPTLAALTAGRILALANKESLIVGGSLVTSLAAPGQIVPVDSEHSAIAQALLAGEHHEVRRLVLTASGGPFRGRSRASGARAPHVGYGQGHHDQLVDAHQQGPRGHRGPPALRRAVRPHRRDGAPAVVVHSMVEFVDGSTIAQCSPPDMRLPISLGLDWPHRVAGVGVPLDWSTVSTWTFAPLDDDAFPAVSLAKQVGAAGATFPAVFNAANEQAVHAFHDGHIGYLGIVDLVREVVDRHEAHPMTLEGVLEAEVWARREADALIAAA
jgi:1-deoxy-D-xylulose-5-phosphate reductoisomerase